MGGWGGRRAGATAGAAKQARRCLWCQQRRSSRSSVPHPALRTIPPPPPAHLAVHEGPRGQHRGAAGKGDAEEGGHAAHLAIGIHLHTRHHAWGVGMGCGSGIGGAGAAADAPEGWHRAATCGGQQEQGRKLARSGRHRAISPSHPASKADGQRHAASPSRMCRLGVPSSTRRMLAAYSSLSVCARSAHTAGPLLAFSTRFCR